MSSPATPPDMPCGFIPGFGLHYGWGAGCCVLRESHPGPGEFILPGTFIHKFHGGNTTSSLPVFAKCRANGQVRLDTEEHGGRSAGSTPQRARPTCCLFRGTILGRALLSAQGCASRMQTIRRPGPIFRRQRPRQSDSTNCDNEHKANFYICESLVPAHG